jgi:hypothetical protein
MARPKETYNITPDELMEYWVEYLEWNSSNPIIEEVVSVKGEIVQKKIPRPLLRQAFEAWVFENKKIGVNHYIDNYKNAYEDFLPIVTHIRNQWQNNQIGMTLAGVYKAPNLVARINGIKDNVQETGDKTISVNVKYDKGNNNTPE